MGMALNGSSQSTSAAYSSALVFPNGNWTMSLWVKATRVGDYANNLISWNSTGNYPNWNLWLPGSTYQYDPGKLRLYSKCDGNSATRTLTAAFTASTTDWFHVLVQRVGITGTVYVNGTSVGSADSALFTSVDYTNGAMFFGRVGGGTAKQFLLGSLAEVAFWTSAVSESNRALLTSGYYPTAIGVAPVWYLPFLTNSVDSMGQLTLTDAGSPTFSAANHPTMTDGLPDEEPAPVLARHYLHQVC